QKFNLSLDLGGYYAYVFDKKFRQTDCKQPSGRRRLFDRYSSTTYRQQTADHYALGLESDQYFDYCIGPALLSGVIGRDVLSPVA
ncbi:hypothetical protein AAVH_11403, partial [Aphelenchoides avenae]